MSLPTYVHGDWRWEPSIGLRYGLFKGKHVVQVHQPLMTSPWWTLSTDNDREDFARIFRTSTDAIRAAEEEYEGRPKPLTLDEANGLLKEAADLLQSAQPQHRSDRGLAMAWGRRRKALVNRVIDAGLLT